MNDSERRRATTTEHGSIPLNDIKKVLQPRGHKVEFQIDGMLVCVSLDDSEGAMTAAAALVQAQGAIARLAHKQGQRTDRRSGRASAFDAWAYPTE